MTSIPLSAHLLSRALVAIDAATADLELVTVIDGGSATAADARIVADALAAEAQAIEAVVARLLRA